MLPPPRCRSEAKCGGAAFGVGGTLYERPPVQGAPCWGSRRFFSTLSEACGKKIDGGEASGAGGNLLGGAARKKKKSRSEAECFFFSCGGQRPARLALRRKTTRVNRSQRKLGWDRD